MYVTANFMIQYKKDSGFHYILSFWTHRQVSTVSAIGILICQVYSVKATIKITMITQQTLSVIFTCTRDEPLGTGDSSEDSTRHTVPPPHATVVVPISNNNSNRLTSDQPCSPVPIRPEKLPPLLQRLKIILLSASRTCTVVSADCFLLYHAVLPYTQFIYSCAKWK